MGQTARLANVNIAQPVMVLTVPWIRFATNLLLVLAIRNKFIG